jgi:hypothetical protein
MSNTNRNPKELKDIIERSKSRTNNDERSTKTETELLNLQIDEQSQLIQFYKVFLIA